MTTPEIAGMMRLINQRQNVAIKAITASTPTDDQTKMANSPRAKILKNPGNGMADCMR